MKSPESSGPNGGWPSDYEQAKQHHCLPYYKVKARKAKLEPCNSSVAVSQWKALIKDMSKNDFIWKHPYHVCSP